MLNVFRCAFVVSPLKEILCKDIVDITPYLNDNGPLASEPLLPLGLVDYCELVSRVLIGHKSPDTRSFKDEHRWSTDTSISQVLDDDRVSPGEMRPKQRKRAVFDEGALDKAPTQPRSASLGMVVVPTKRDRIERLHASTSGYSPRPRAPVYGQFGINIANL